MEGPLKTATAAAVAGVSSSVVWQVVALRRRWPRLVV